MKEKIRWGVLGAAKIAVEKVIPAMQQGEESEIVAIASRNSDRARETAHRLGIEKAYGSYEELLNDPEIDAVYNPLPNHLHVPWTIRAAEAGKHVLCEKPVALDVQGVKQLIETRDRTGVKIGEAFMIRTHPQWQGSRKFIQEGRIGELRALQGFFSYYLVDPANIRNVLEDGGGGMMDIGCCPINTSRFITGEEPRRVIAHVELDPVMKIDRLASVILDFPSIQASFLCGTQMVGSQRMFFFGTSGRLEIEIPFNASPDRPCRVFISEGDFIEDNQRTLTFPVANQYTIQGDLFSRAIKEDGEVPVPLEDSLRNMAVIEAVLRSGRSGNWEVPEY